MLLWTRTSVLTCRAVGQRGAMGALCPFTVDHVRGSCSRLAV